MLKFKASAKDITNTLDELEVALSDIEKDVRFQMGLDYLDCINSDQQVVLILDPDDEDTEDYTNLLDLVESNIASFFSHQPQQEQFYEAEAQRDNNEAM